MAAKLAQPARSALGYNSASSMMEGLSQPRKPLSLLTGRTHAADATHLLSCSGRCSSNWEEFTALFLFSLQALLFALLWCGGMVDSWVKLRCFVSPDQLSKGPCSHLSSLNSTAGDPQSDSNGAASQSARVLRRQSKPVVPFI